MVRCTTGSVWASSSPMPTPGRPPSGWPRWGIGSSSWGLKTASKSTDCRAVRPSRSLHPYPRRSPRPSTVSEDVIIRATCPRHGVTRPPPGSVMSVIDSNGTVLARHPDPEQWVGRSARELPIVKTVLAQGGGVVEAPGLDGVPRLFGFTPLHNTPHGPDMYIRIGIPRSTAYAEADRLLARSLIGLGLVGALTLVVAWVFANRFILRGVRTLMRGAERLKAGDLTARVEVTGRGELSTLAVRFNEMADGLQEAYGQLAAHVRELKRQTQELNLLRTIDLMLLADAPLQDLLDKAVEACALTAGSKTCVLVTVGPEGGALTPVATFGPDLEGIRQYFATLKPRVGEQGGALARAIARRAPVVISD